MPCYAGICILMLLFSSLPFQYLTGSISANHPVDKSFALTILNFKNCCTKKTILSWFLLFYFVLFFHDFCFDKKRQKYYKKKRKNKFCFRIFYIHPSPSTKKCGYFHRQKYLHNETSNWFSWFFSSVRTFFTT